MGPVKNILESKWYIDIENDSRVLNTLLQVYQGVTLGVIHDTIEKIKLRESNKRKILVRLAYGSFISVTMWLIIDMFLDYFSHMGVDEPLFP